MLSATTRPWYLATWVNRATPVTSPTAHRPGPAPVVDGDPAAPGQRHSRGIQPEPRSSRATAGAEDHHVGLHLAAVIQRHHRHLAGLAGADGGDPGADGDTLGGKRAGGQLADARVLAIDEPVRPLHDGRLGAHPGVELA